MFIHREVRHTLICYAEQVSIVLLILGVSESEVCHDFYSVADKVVEGYAGGKTVELLLDDRAGLMVISSTDTEVSLFTTASE